MVLLIPEAALMVERAIATSVEHAEDGSDVMRIGDTCCQRAAGGRPRNKVYCFGEPDADKLGEILAFYADGGLEPMFCLSPARFGPRTSSALSAAGFAQIRFDQAMLYAEVDALRPISLDSWPVGLEISEVSDTILDSYVHTFAAAFEWDPAWRDAAMDDLRTQVSDQAPVRLLASLDGEPAGVASVRFDQKMASLGDSAVRPEFRRRGVHAALIGHRVELARDSGVDVVMCGARYGSPSFRNQQRAGLQIAYIESAWARPGANV